ncbi:MAG: flippase-like domain-containing protein [Chitinispirillaceae bacterium]|nr:flippase-like domain-containing protein [Chitinispirillaceae bacterium]
MYRRAVQACRKTGDLLSRSPIKATIRIAVTVVFVMFVNRSIGKSDILRLSGRVHPLPVFLALILGAASFFFQMLRWRLILRAHGFPCSLMVSLKTMLRGCLLAFITPGRIGEFFRTMPIDGRRHIAGVLAVVEERSFAVATTALAGGACLIAQALWYASPLFLPLVIALMVFLAAVALLIAALYKGETLLNRSNRFTKLSGRPVDYLKRIRSRPFPQLMALSAGAHLLLLLQTALLFRMYGSGDFGRTMIAAGQSFFFMLLLPVFIANIGLREYSFALFLSRLSAPSDIGLEVGSIALAASTSILLINIIFPAIIGLIWMYHEKKSVSEANCRHRTRNPHSIAV